MVDRARYVFQLSAWNELAGVDDAFLLIYYVKNDGSGEVEIQDPKHKRRFLSRVPYPQLKVDDIRPGGRIMIFSRQYKVEGYEDKVTRDALSKSQSGCLVIIAGGGSAVSQVIGQVWQSCEAQVLRIVDAKIIHISDDDVKMIVKDISGDSKTSNSITSGPMLILSVMGEDSFQKVQVLAHTFSSSSSSLPRGCNVLFASDPAADVRLQGAFFGDIKYRLKSANESSGHFSDCSCLCVLPSTVANGQAGSVLAELQSSLSSSNLSISALRIANFSRSQAEEFVEVYKAVVPEYVDMINEFSKGPFVALEITGNDAVNKIRDICGPRDIEVAKRVRPHTLRAKFGTSAGSSGVHCTDLVEDGPLECEFIFALLQQ